MLTEFGNFKSGYVKGTIRSDERLLVVSNEVRRHRLISIRILAHLAKLAVQGRYKQTLCLWVSSCSLQGIAERPLPCNYNVIQSVFHGGNTGSNPVGDAKSIRYRRNVYSLFKRRIENPAFREPLTVNQSKQSAVALVLPPMCVSS